MVLWWNAGQCGTLALSICKSNGALLTFLPTPRPSLHLECFTGTKWHHSFKGSCRIEVKMTRTSCCVLYRVNGWRSLISNGTDGSRKIFRLITSESLDKSPTKRGAHKAVCNGIATTAGLGEELQKRDASIAETFIKRSRSEKGERVDHVERRPTDEKLEHDDNQHFENASLRFQTVLRVASSKTRSHS